jgi:aminocarboxymuconate-semialdehyde decarboxylase
MSKPRVIDLHNHVIPMTFVNAMRAEPARYGMRIEDRDGKIFYERRGKFSELRPVFYDAGAKLAAMDEMGIDIAALSAAPPVFLHHLEADVALAAARHINDGIAQLVAQQPARLRGMAFLPMQHPDAAIAELERVVREYKFKSVEIATSIDGAQVADPKFRPVLRTIEQLGCFVFTHPYQCSAKGAMDDYEFYNLLGFPFDTTLMVSHLMFSGALDELKSLKIVLSHGGGYIPFQIGRLAHGYKMRASTRRDCKTSPADLLRRFYFDALTHDPQAARYLIDKVGADRVVIGTDHPFDMGPENLQASIDAIPGLTADERAQICERTAAALLDEN